MCYQLNRYKILSNISEETKNKIKLFHVFDDIKGYNVLFITSEDKVFGFGANYFGGCGLGHNNVINEPQVIPELCNKNIKQFFIGYDFVLSLNINLKLYSWGRNNCGQLGRGFITEPFIFLKPECLQIIPNKIIQICCGSVHSLALLSNGVIYGWGNNVLGQVGCGISKGEKISQPVKFEIKSETSIKSLYASYRRSFALTMEGQVYCWGEICSWNLESEINFTQAIFEPKLLEISSIISICPSNIYTYFLNLDGSIYAYFHEKNQFSKLDNQTKFKSLYFLPTYQNINTINLALAQDTIYTLIGNNMINMKNKTLFDFLSDIQMTLKTIEIDCDDCCNNDNILTDKNEITTKIPNRDGKFKNVFNTLEIIGMGGFGQVYKVKNILNNQHFAIKVIKYEGTNKINDILREVEILSKCSFDYVVRYYYSWIEDNNYLYIQMELCSQNLKDIIMQKPNYFGREVNQPMNISEYFISYQMIKELLECVQYLHESNPPIIHRDLKPANILITYQPTNGRFLKLCDFGCAKFIQATTNTQSHTANVGTVRYMAPEVHSDYGIKCYNTSADIYSLGIIAQELFDFNITNPGNIINNELLTNNWKNLEHGISSMLQFSYKKRPRCDEILYMMKLWKLKKTDLSKFDKLLSKNKEKCSNNFLNTYLAIKLSLLDNK